MSFDDDFQMKQAMVGQGGYGNEPQGLRKMTVREETQANLKYHQRQVEIKTELLKLLDENPAIEKFMDLSRQ